MRFPHIPVNDLPDATRNFEVLESNTALDLTNGPPSVTGSRGGNAALASLLTKLAARGLIIDNTTV